MHLRRPITTASRASLAYLAHSVGYTVVRESLLDSVVATTVTVDPTTGIELDQGAGASLPR